MCIRDRGIGVIYRRDFDNPFTFLKRKKRPMPEKSDSTESRKEGVSVIEKKNEEKED